MVKIINNADDFGYSNAINYGIIDCYLNGMLTSTTLMPAMPGFDHAVALAKQNPGLGIGVHLTLTCGRPVLEGHKT
ncbi:MAG: ChbG/HpnK family deacetylase, partial [Coprobacillus sp.]